MRTTLIGLGILGWALLTSAVAQTNAPAAASTKAPAALAELPDWPVGMMMPAELKEGQKPSKSKGLPKAEVLVWTPPNAKRIRAILLVPNNSDSKDCAQHAAIRDVFAKHEVGIVYLRNYNGNIIERVDPPVATNTIFALLAAVAKETGIVEFQHAPWITFGKSSRGMFPFRMAWQYPARTIASIDYHGETPHWPMPAWSRVKDETILHLNINGSEEWDRTWYRHVRPNLLNYRAQTGWLTHQVVVNGVGHSNYADGCGSPGWGQPVPAGVISCLRVWDYIAVYYDKVLSLRLPKGQYPTDGPVKLNQVDPATGYLIHPRAPEELLSLKWRPLRQADGVYTIVDHIKEPGEVFDPNPGKVDASLLIRKATDVPAAERKGLFWVADKEQADAWLKLHTPPK